MSPSPSRQKSANWAFWLMVAGWWCANSPQAATFELILWMKGAATFSHQAKLHTEVAALLRGDAPSPAAHVVKVLSHEAPAGPVSIPASAAIQRVELGLETIIVSAPRTGDLVRLDAADDRAPVPRCCPPFLRPPRLA